MIVAAAESIDASVADDRRRLAAELQRERHEVLGGGAHDDLPHARRAGEDEVIERQPRERLADLGPSGHDDTRSRSNAAVDHVDQRARRLGRELARLHHRAVARGDRAHERRERELHRVVPRRRRSPRPRAAAAHLGRRREEREPDLARLGAHPLAEVRLREADLVDDDEDLGGERLVLRSVAEVARHRVGEHVLLCRGRPARAFEHRDARVGARRPALPLRRLEARERRGEIVLVRGGRDGIGRGGAHARSLSTARPAAGIRARSSPRRRRCRPP